MPTRDPTARRVLTALAGLLALAACAAALVLWLLHPPTSERRADFSTTPGSADLQTAPQSDLAAYHAQKQADIGRTGPDPDAPGYARIPIDRAMALMSERGLRAGKRPPP